MAKPIRSEFYRRVGHGPWKPIVHELGAKEIHHRLDSSGSIESETTEHEVPFHCGCFGERGGACSGCSQLICAACYTRCQACGASLGPCCARADRTGVFCKECHGKRNRWRLLKLALSPFVEFDDAS